MTPINTETPSPPPATKPLLLLVDDIPSNLHVLAAALRADYRIKTATNGRTALGLAKHSDPPDLILLDVMMPEMSGIDVLRHLRQSPDTAGIPVIFVSADVSEETQLQGLDLGADDYLSKPVIASLLRVRIRNLLQRKRDEARLRLAAHVFRCCGEAILVADRDNRIIDVNPAFTRISGYTLDDVRGHETGFFLAPRPTLAKDFRQLLALSSNPEVAKQEVLLLSKDGTLRPQSLTVAKVKGPQGDSEFFIGTYADISEQKAAEERMRQEAYRDSLTGLANRLHLQSALARALALARREKRGLAVLFLDLDRFKAINDTLGHAVGDSLLIAIAGRLSQCVRASDIVARLGGDEFVVVLCDDQSCATAARTADKIRQQLSLPYPIDTHLVNTTPSIGISLFSRDGTDLATLLKHADEAMYHAKSSGGGRYMFYADLPAT